jgi:flagellin
MTIKIGSNLASLTAQRRLGEADAALSKTFERLSSGQRINRASDDAAGLAIADELNAKGRIYTQGIRNGNDGISLLNIADSAIDALTSVVVRIRELSEQSANGTYSDAQRKALDAEAQALSKEFTRITQTTSFNGLKIFDGSLGDGVRLQLGVGVSESINASIGGDIGTGNFGDKMSLATEISGIGTTVSNASTLGDLNGDGILDLVTAGNANNQGQANVQLGRGDGSFGNKMTFATETSGVGSASTNSIILGDVNGDNILDLVTAGYASDGSRPHGQANVLLGRGDGSFGNKMTFVTETNLVGPSQSYAVSLGDVNSDEILDLITAGDINEGLRTQGKATVLLGRGDGNFGNKMTFDTQTTVSGRASSFSLSLGDVNGDSILDLVTAGYAFNGSRYQGQASVLLGTGNGSFGNKVSFATETSTTSGAGSYSLTLGDVNGDSILDLVTAGMAYNGSSYQGQANVLLGTGDGSFGNKITFNTQVSGTGPSSSYALSLGDVSGDGILDLVTTGFAHNGSLYQGQATAFLGTGNGNFGNKITFNTQTSGSGSAVSRSVNLGDVNGDGVLDMLTAGFAHNGSSNQGQASVLLAQTEEGLGAILEFSLKTKADSLQSMGMLDRTLENLAKQRGTIGASQSRVNIAISNLQSSKENFAAAESRIRDADIASEAADLTRTQILQQAAASVLAQANQQPQLALRLLS